MAIIIPEREVENLLDMKEVVAAVEEAFRRQGLGQAHNSIRTRSTGAGSVLSVMHANLDYIGRGGIKAYMASRSGTKFVVVLFDSSTSKPLAVLGADTLGRFRTGAASGVATKHLYGGPSATVALFGSGKQALTQALALQAVLSVESIRVWSPSVAHREDFALALKRHGFDARAFSSPREAMAGAEVASAITSSRDPFITEEMLGGVSHVNICGGNVPGHAEIAPSAVKSFGTVGVDDLTQAKEEYGDLIHAVDAGFFSWSSAVELCRIVVGKPRTDGKTLFKSGGVALEDVAVASAIYDKAMASGRFSEVELV